MSAREFINGYRPRAGERFGEPPSQAEDAVGDGLTGSRVMPISAARLAAFEILLRVQEQGAYASELLHSGRLASLSAADRGLCTELVMGTLRWQSVLDRRHSGSLLAKTEPD